MEFIKNWALGVCISALAGALVYALAPKGKLQKSLRTAVTLAVICALVAPFAENGLDIGELPEIRSEEEASPELESVVEYQLTAAFSQEYEAAARRLLAAQGIEECEISLLTDINDSGGIFIKEASILLPQDAVLGAQTNEALEELLGGNVSVEYG